MLGFRLSDKEVTENGICVFASTLTSYTKGRGWIAGNFFVFDPSEVRREGPAFFDP